MDPILLLPSETSRLPGAEILDFNENDDFEQDTALSIDCDFFDDLFEDALERETQIADNIVSMNVDKVKYTYTDYDLLDDLEEKSKVVPRNVQLETSGDCGEELDQDVTLGFEDDLFEDDRRSVAIRGLEAFAVSYMKQLAALSGNLSLTTHKKARIQLQLANRKRILDDGHIKCNEDGVLPADEQRVSLFEHGDIYYRNPTLFKRQSTVDRLVDDIAATLNLGRADLNVRASGKGLFCGSALTIHLLRGGSVRGNDSEGCIIPDAADISNFEIQDDIRWVLVVEKEAVFRTLCSLGWTENEQIGRGLVVTGKGYPDVATRQFVKTLSDNLPREIPLLVLVDGDPYGLDILSVYKFGSVQMRYEKESLVSDRVEWLGLWMSELADLGVDSSALIPMTEHDRKKALAMLSRPTSAMPDEWRNELEYMLQTGLKAEIEILLSLPRAPLSSDWTTSNDDNLDIIEEPGPRRPHSHPLARYLTEKMTAVLSS